MGIVWVPEKQASFGTRDLGLSQLIAQKLNQFLVIRKTDKTNKEPRH